MLSFLQSIVTTILLAFILRFFVIQPFVVEGSSMEPNFHNEEYIVIDKISYRFRPPQRGEVVVLHPPIQPDQNYIKRIIGLPGEKISIQDGDVFINGQKIEESYLGTENHKTEPLNQRESATLGPDEYFVLGDNRSHSSDSREWGKLPKENIEGRTWVIAYPFSNFQIVTAPKYGSLLSSFEQKVLHVVLAETRS